MIPMLVLAANLALPPLQEAQEMEAKSEGLLAVEALRTEFEQATSAFWKAYGEASEEERPAMIENDRPDPEEWAETFLELATEHAGTEAAAAAYAWVAQNVEDEETSGGALTNLLEHHIESPFVSEVCGTLERRLGDGTVYLERILEATPHADVRGQACYAIGKNWLSQARMSDRLATMNEAQHEAYRSYLGSGYDRIVGSDSDELAKKAEAYLERVVAEFPEGNHWRGSLGKAAKGDLFEIRSLALGMIAPDIEGEDVEGVSFKLSDYRGKVVVLDFWGHW